ncbi:MAG: Trk system potassium transporter TrkA [Thermoguttaceae bacterium]|nr:Trk system potassium transporter TrkA [Thermoguttaceae bacterium]MDW8036573.1 Trk system potassium transporter TrkA [Thermoguttaceae bacterium]
MRVVVLGAGTVGSSIAELLCNHRHEVTVVDRDPDCIRRVRDELDVRAITGSASQSSVLFQAEVGTADLCLAVTGVDEVNIVAASLAKAMGARRTLARVYSPVFRDLSTFDYQRHFRIDRLLSLEYLSALELARTIRYPGALLVEDFARGEVQMQAFALTEPCSTMGIPLRELKLPKGVRIGSIHRGKQIWIAGAEDRLQVGDHITVIGALEQIDEVKELFSIQPPPKQRVVIAGGGETGYQLAQLLHGRRFSLMILEWDKPRCEFLSSHLENVDIICTDIRRRQILEEERIGQADVFAACTGDDENNIMACVEARELGVKTCLAVINRPDYANVIGKLGIAHAVSPRQVIARHVLAFLNTGPVVSRLPLTPDGPIDVLEIEVLDKAPVTNHVLAKAALPAQCLVAAVIREQFGWVPGADDRLQPGDTVVVLADRSVEEQLIRLFSSD